MKISDEMVEKAAKVLCAFAMGEAAWEKDYKPMWRQQARAALEAVLSDPRVLAEALGGRLERRCRDHPCAWCGTSTVAVGAGCCVEPVLLIPLSVEGEE